MLLSQLEEGHFVDGGGEFQLELSLSAVRSTYEHRDDHSQTYLCLMSIFLMSYQVVLQPPCR